MSKSNLITIPWTWVQPLSVEERAIDASGLASMATAWAELRTSMAVESGSAPDEFYAQLRREWAIETGVLEGLYTLDRGTTKTLIDKGFERDLIEHTATDLEPGRLLRILEDHQDASDMVDFAVHEQRPMSTLMVTELHKIITRNQEEVPAQNTLGQLVMATPLRGNWKIHPNTIPGAGGVTIETCPPEQVASQIDELLGYLELEEQEKTDVGIIAAWFHHQFSKIHPFQDGNGRVVRALTNYLFLKHGLFPAVVTRDDRDTYLYCLGEADQGNLEYLVHFFGIKQINAIKQVLSIHRGLGETEGTNMVRDLARGIVLRDQDRREKERQQLRQVDDVLRRLSVIAQEHIQQELQSFVDEMRTGAFAPALPRVTRGGSFDLTGHFYRDQVIEMARQANEWVNFNEQALWVRALVIEKISRLRFLLSFHHIGSELTGVAEVTALGEWTYRATDDPSPTDEQLQTKGPDNQQIKCMPAGTFTVTWADDPDKLAIRFRSWLTACLVVALRDWADTL